jgi:hypothetical protein
MSRRKNPAKLFAVCINNESYKASLEVGKLYQIVPDNEAASHGYLTVIDESGEGYWYAPSRFFPVEIPVELARALSVAA